MDFASLITISKVQKIVFEIRSAIRANAVNQGEFRDTIYRIICALRGGQDCNLIIEAAYQDQVVQPSAATERE